MIKDVVFIRADGQYDMAVAETESGIRTILYKSTGSNSGNRGAWIPCSGFKTDEQNSIQWNDNIAEAKKLWIIKGATVVNQELKSKFLEPIVRNSQEHRILEKRMKYFIEHDGKNHVFDFTEVSESVSKEWHNPEKKYVTIAGSSLGYQLTNTYMSFVLSNGIPMDQMRAGRLIHTIINHHIRTNQELEPF